MRKNKGKKEENSLIQSYNVKKYKVFHNFIGNIVIIK